MLTLTLAGRGAVRQGGVTLIELMITLAVLAILLALAGPSFAEFFEKNRLRGAADDITSLLANARQEAVARDRDVRVTVGGSTTAWCVGANAAANPATSAAPVPAATACDCTNAAQCMVGGQRFAVSSANYGEVTIDAVGDTFTYDSKLGTVDNLVGATFDLTSPSGDYVLRIAVKPLGQSRVCVPAGSTAVSGFRSC